ncbi:MAG TPA: methenyltetrahydrofolate cyclohydrolase [Methylococcaceae bacterium]|nr:methenyltetrahydrofolate cyclohydrolase [Methylococcaceae bacterium]
MTQIKDSSLQSYLDTLASKNATPGGGSAAALMGAQSAALTSMVCHLTIGKANYADVEADMKTLLIQSEALREELTAMIKADVDIFNALMATYALPKDTDEEKAARSTAIQHVLKDATDVPLACAKACAQAIALSKIAAQKGSTAVISDAGVAVMSGYAGLKSAALNVYINTASLKDKAFAQTKIAELTAILNEAEVSSHEIYELVKTRL